MYITLFETFTNGGVHPKLLAKLKETDMQLGFTLCFFYYLPLTPPIFQMESASLGKFSEKAQ